jgi:hypothetical protein
MRKYHGHDLQFFPGNMEIKRNEWCRKVRLRLPVLVAYCESDALQVCQEIPGDDQGVSDEDLGGGDGGAHV